MKYFRIIKSATGDTYSLVLQSWELDENGKEINHDGLNKNNLTLDDSDKTEMLFRLYGSKLMGNK